MHFHLLQHPPLCNARGSLDRPTYSSFRIPSIFGASAMHIRSPFTRLDSCTVKLCGQAAEVDKQLKIPGQKLHSVFEQRPAYYKRTELG